MIWYYAKEGKPTGPFESPEFQKLVNEGAIRPETMVWNETMTRWERWEAVQPREPIPPGPPPPLPTSTPQNSVICSSCGKPVALDQRLLLHDRSVCPECKPNFVQAIKEGWVPPHQSTEAAALDAAALLRHSKAHATPPRLSTILRESLQLLQTEWGTLAGSTFLYSIITVVIALGLEFATSYLPQSTTVTVARDLITSAIAGAVTSPMFASLLWLFLKVRREEEHPQGLFTSGFQQPAFKHLVLIGVCESILTSLVFLPMSVLMAHAETTEAASELKAVDWAALAAALVGFGLYIINWSLWSLAPLLVMDRRYDWKDALITSASLVWHHRPIIPVILFLALLGAMTGVAALGLGIILTLPFAFCPIIILYERLCGRELGKERTP